MNGLFRIIVVIFLFSLTSCKNYYYFNGQQKVETDHPDRYEKFILTFDEGKQNIPFYTYGDYRFKKVDKRYIYFKVLRKKLYRLNTSLL